MSSPLHRLVEGAFACSSLQRRKLASHLAQAHRDGGDHRFLRRTRSVDRWGARARNDRRRRAAIDHRVLPEGDLFDAVDVLLNTAREGEPCLDLLATFESES